MALGAALLLAAPAPAEELSPLEGYRTVSRLMSGDRQVRREAAEDLRQARDMSLLPAIVDTIFFTARQYRDETLELLRDLTGEERDSYLEWVEYVGSREDIQPKERYWEWKQALLQRIDPEYGKVFYEGVPTRIRLPEVVSGGVKLDGIPSLDFPPRIPASEARYLNDDDKVFGVSLGGESVAYPLRFLSWHEMLNDEVGGVPVTLSYCTLCGSGILYSAETPAGRRHFGTSGLLYRSNKLMYDRESYTLWSNLTGKPVVGRLANRDVALEVLPMTLTTWEEWLARHPDTETLELEGVEREHDSLFDYRPGAADRARRGVSFPVWLKSDALERDAEVYAMHLGGVAKAYPLERLFDERVVNDELGSQPLVLVADRNSGAVRAFVRGDLSFRPGNSPGELMDQEGRSWRMGEERLVPASEELEPLERLPGHVAYWFGWYAFYPRTEIYQGV